MTQRIPVGPACPVAYHYLFDDGSVLLPVTNMYDVYGDPTTERSRVHNIVAYDGRRDETPWSVYTPVTPEELEPRPTAAVN